jgi:hypothetical protein
MCLRNPFFALEMEMGKEMEMYSKMAIERGKEREMLYTKMAIGYGIVVGHKKKMDIGVD